MPEKPEPNNIFYAAAAVVTDGLPQSPEYPYARSGVYLVDEPTHR